MIRYLFPYYLGIVYRFSFLQTFTFFVEIRGQHYLDIIVGTKEIFVDNFQCFTITITIVTFDHIY